MRVFILVAALVSMTGCATTAAERRRADILSCTKDLRDGDPGSTLDSFEVCRQLYRLRKVDDRVGPKQH